MGEPHNKSQLLATMRRERAQWNALLAEVGEAQMTEPGVAGAWSVKDIIAHITWYERESFGILQARALVGSELWELSVDQRNAAIFEANHPSGLEWILDRRTSALTG